MKVWHLIKSTPIRPTEQVSLLNFENYFKQNKATDNLFNYFEQTLHLHDELLDKAHLLFTLTSSNEELDSNANNNNGTSKQSALEPVDNETHQMAERPMFKFVANVGTPHPKPMNDIQSIYSFSGIYK